MWVGQFKLIPAVHTLFLLGASPLLHYIGERGVHFHIPSDGRTLVKPCENDWSAYAKCLRQIIVPECLRLRPQAECLRQPLISHQCCQCLYYRNLFISKK